MLSPPPHSLSDAAAFLWTFCCWFFFWLIVLCCMALLNPCVFRVSYNSSLMLQISPNNLIFMALNSSKTQCCTALSSFPDDNWSMKLLVRQSFKNLSNLTSNTCSDWQMLSYIEVFTPKEANEHRVTPPSDIHATWTWDLLCSSAPILLRTMHW